MVPLAAVLLFCLLAMLFSVLYLSVPQAICDVSLAQISDVDKAVAAAKEAFEEGEWGKMNPRDRGRLIYKSVHLVTHTLIKTPTLLNIQANTLASGHHILYHVLYLNYLFYLSSVRYRSQLTRCCMVQPVYVADKHDCQ